MQSVRFYENNHERGVELTLSPSVAKHRLYLDLLVAINDDRVTIKHPLTKKELDKYKQQLEVIDSVLFTHGLLDRAECKYHHANLLFFVMEFNLKHKDLLKKKDQDARLENIIKFLQLVKPLTPVQKQSVQMSFTINREPFAFEDQPILSEMVINKLSGVLMNNICQLYPELWEAHLRRGGNSKLVKERAKADSALQNQAVADITKLLIAYLNAESPKLRNKTKGEKLTLKSKPGGFIFDLLTELNIYDPREVNKSETSGKEAPYHGLRKLIKRY